MEETQLTQRFDLARAAAEPPLFVDLDGTLLAVDLLPEAVLSAACRQPLQLLRALVHLPQGRAAFKRVLAETVPFDPQNLPWREEVLEMIVAQRANGRAVVLATAADSAWAQAVADELGLFDDTLTSNGVNNLKGENKLAAIRDWCRREGFEAFDYAGDSAADLPIWRAARRAYLVAPSAAVAIQARANHADTNLLCRRPGRLAALARLLRPHQWIKNLLVLVPLVTSHRLLELPLLVAALTALVSFCLAASAVYVLNDLLDLSADRKHPSKRNRPFASGAIPVAWGPPLVVALGGAGLGLAAWFLPPAFAAALVVYVAATTLYSAWLKRVAMLDVIVLACLYTLRVLAGGLAVGIVVSEWLMAFSLFIFVSLAFAKRYTELARLGDDDGTTLAHRGYRRDDLTVLEVLGPASGLVAVLVLALYIQSQQMQRLYSQPWALWLLCPLLLYWISRVWMKAKRRELDYDPVVFAARDMVSLAVAALAGVLLCVASWHLH